MATAPVDGGRHGRSLYLLVTVSIVAVRFGYTPPSRPHAHTGPAGVRLVTGRHGHRLAGAQDGPLAATEEEASQTATAIAGLCWRLQRQEILEHPKVRSALRKLEEQLTEHPAYTEGKRVATVQPARRTASRSMTPPAMTSSPTRTLQPPPQHSSNYCDNTGPGLVTHRGARWQSVQDRPSCTRLCSTR
jgi:hypothetical protein